MARPTTTTSRSAARAASATARKRATFEAKVVTATRPRAVLISSAIVFADIGFRRRAAFAHGIGGIADQRETAFLAQRAQLLLVGADRRGSASDRSSSRRCAAQCRSGVRMMSAFDSGIECAIVTSSTSNGPTLKRLPSGTMVTGISGAPGSLGAFGLEQRGGEWRGVDRHLQPRPQIEQRAEMILMRVGEHEPGKILALLHQIADVGQDQIDAGQMLFGGERHAEIDRQPGACCASPRP